MWLIDEPIHVAGLVVSDVKPAEELSSRYVGFSVYCNIKTIKFCPEKIQTLRAKQPGALSLYYSNNMHLMFIQVYNLIYSDLNNITRGPQMTVFCLIQQQTQSWQQQRLVLTTPADVIMFHDFLISWWIKRLNLSRFESFQ